MTPEGKITFRSLLLGALLSGVFAVITVFFENRSGQIVTANQIAVLPYALLFVVVLLINPFCRMIRFVRRFTVTEILLIFIMCSVSAGVSTFGLASQLVPMIGNLFNGQWNNDLSRWDIYIEPYVNENFFIAQPGTRTAASRRYSTG